MSSIAAISLKVASAVLLDSHSSAWLAFATASNLLVLPSARIDVDVAIGMEHGLCFHLHILQQELLFEIFLHNLI